MGITDAGLAHLEEMPGLRKLYIQHCQVSDAGLVHVKKLTKLKSLYFSGTNITDAGLEHLQEMGNLEMLVLLDTKRITGEGIADLKKALPKCKINQ